MLKYSASAAVKPHASWVPTPVLRALVYSRTHQVITVRCRNSVAASHAPPWCHGTFQLMPKSLTGGITARFQNSRRNTMPL